MSGCVAAAAALHFLPASMATGVPPLMGLASGSLGLSRADIKLLADSDSDSEVDDAGTAMSFRCLWGGVDRITIGRQGRKWGWRVAEVWRRGGVGSRACQFQGQRHARVNPDVVPSSGL